jgi:hypothetical protein
MADDKEAHVSKGSIGLGTLLSLIFLVLKILGDNGVINPVSFLVSQPGWGGWDVVFFPLWIGAAVAVGLFLLFLIIAFIAAFIGSLCD